MFSINPQDAAKFTEAENVDTRWPIESPQMQSAAIPQGPGGVKRYFSSFLQGMGDALRKQAGLPTSYELDAANQEREMQQQAFQLQQEFRRLQAANIKSQIDNRTNLSSPATLAKLRKDGFKVQTAPDGTQTIVPLTKEELSLPQRAKIDVPQTTTVTLNKEQAAQLGFPDLEGKDIPLSQVSALIRAKGISTTTWMTPQGMFEYDEITGSLKEIRTPDGHRIVPTSVATTNANLTGAPIPTGGSSGVASGASAVAKPVITGGKKSESKDIEAQPGGPTFSSNPTVNSLVSQVLSGQRTVSQAIAGLPKAVRMAFEAAMAKAEQQGYINVDEKTRDELVVVDALFNSVDKFERMYNKQNADMTFKRGVGRFLEGKLKDWSADLRNDPLGQMMLSLQASYGPLARSVSLERGVLTNQDIGRVESAVPKIETGDITAAEMLAELRLAAKLKRKALLDKNRKMFRSDSDEGEIKGQKKERPKIKGLDF